MIHSKTPLIVVLGVAVPITVGALTWYAANEVSAADVKNNKEQIGKLTELQTKVLLAVERLVVNMENVTKTHSEDVEDLDERIDDIEDREREALRTRRLRDQH